MPASFSVGLVGCALACVMALAGGTARADYAGSARLFVNDTYGDGHDRWNTGSYQGSYFFSDAPDAGSTLELRGRGEIVTPWAPSLQEGGDRPYSTLLGFGAFLHRDVGPVETRIGGEIALRGDSTGLPELQARAHRFFDYDGYDPETRDDPHLPDRGVMSLEGEVAHTFVLGGAAMVRPYAEARYGDDTRASLGADIVIGGGQDAPVWTRDVVTGQLMTYDLPKERGFNLGLVLGGDIQRVTGSAHLPDGYGVTLEESQSRVRIGLGATYGDAHIFVGQTRLSRQFEEQSEPQRVGMISIGLGF
ncbi:lipid A-modifier LpxR family protein [Tropicimonas sp. IMCC34011]|uniref:lipid A-modifier LpxR family protein n=1 Tax=Tropicimonas sp. IMCC34011 TaxID=2248759 RepID=UPI000E22C724|nr:lipid A-modifier LpxR family protein [Tropicimonas sp. IMCC34011]